MKGKKCTNCYEYRVIVKHIGVRDGVEYKFSECDNCHKHYYHTGVDLGDVAKFPFGKSALQEIKNIRERKREQSKEKSERNI